MADDKQVRKPTTEDCENDGLGGGDLRCVLAATEPSVTVRRGAARTDGPPVVTATHLLARLLARHEQLHLQPHHLLLDELQVSLSNAFILFSNFVWWNEYFIRFLFQIFYIETTIENQVSNLKHKQATETFFF